MPYFGIFELQFKKSIVIFEISTLKFVYLQSFLKKQKCLNWDQECLFYVLLTKKALFGYFWARLLKNYCHICNQHPQICRK